MIKCINGIARQGITVTLHLIPLLRAFNPNAMLHNAIKPSIKRLAWRDASSCVDLRSPSARVKSMAQHKKNWKEAGHFGDSHFGGHFGDSALNSLR
jgi:hypothetical protein